jgi:hypothetical protein
MCRSCMSLRRSRTRFLASCKSRRWPPRSSTDNRANWRDNSPLAIRRLGSAPAHRRAGRMRWTWCTTRACRASGIRTTRPGPTRNTPNRSPEFRQDTPGFARARERRRCSSRPLHRRTSLPSLRRTNSPRLRHLRIGPRCLPLRRRSTSPPAGSSSRRRTPRRP